MSKLYNNAYLEKSKKADFDDIGLYTRDLVLMLSDGITGKRNQ